MGKTIEKPKTLDIVPTHPDWTPEDYERRLKELEERDSQCTEWPDV